MKMILLGSCEKECHFFLYPLHYSRKDQRFPFIIHENKKMVSETAAQTRGIIHKWKMIFLQTNFASFHTK
jgi:hypothetical protein